MANDSHLDAGNTMYFNLQGLSALVEMTRSRDSDGLLCEMVSRDGTFGCVVQVERGGLVVALDDDTFVDIIDNVHGREAKFDTCSIAGRFFSSLLLLETAVKREESSYDPSLVGPRAESVISPPEPQNADLQFLRRHMKVCQRTLAQRPHSSGDWT